MQLRFVILLLQISKTSKIDQLFLAFYIERDFDRPPPPRNLLNYDGTPRVFFSTTPLTTVLSQILYTPLILSVCFNFTVKDYLYTDKM